MSIHFRIIDSGLVLEDYSLIKGSSVFKDKLGEVIADNRFTLHSKPLSGELAGNYFVTNDGYEAQNSTIIEKGILKTFELSLYGSRKTGKTRAVNSGGCYIVEPGETEFEEMIKNTEKGLLLCRFSGGNPNDSGDFSGVAKNSYYIENGEIKYPVSETMISGNLVEMLQNIVEISAERINTGYQIYPWIKFDGVTVSGK
ncbi:MAG: metallopeptidase TldD-related protein [Candidatus Cloacimonadales bacterium]|nr:metallopeptidase TldD-related protein [Candidatus Cloacimonadales bacterium]